MAEVEHKVFTIDIQGFNTPEFTPKELAIYDGEIVKHYHFKSKCLLSELSENCKKQVRWLETNHHGIPFNSGTSDLKDFNEIVIRETEKANVIFCKGYQKINFFKPILGSKIFNQLEDENEVVCKFYPEIPLCNNHRLKMCKCSINNSIRLYKAIFL